MTFFRVLLIMTFLLPAACSPAVPFEKLPKTEPGLVWQYAEKSVMAFLLKKTFIGFFGQHLTRLTKDKMV